MIHQKKLISLAVYIAVIALVFAIIVPVLQERLKQNAQPENLAASPMANTNNNADVNTDNDADVNEKIALNSSTDSSSSSASESEPNFNEIIWPIEGQVLRGVGLSYAQTFSDYRYHDGLDIQAARGAEVLVALPGKVISIETTKEEKTVLTIEHGQEWVSVYAHLEDVFLQVGDYCQAGDLLGTINQPGLQEVLEGPHLHFSLKQDNQIINPLDYLPPRP